MMYISRGIGCAVAETPAQAPPPPAFVVPEVVLNVLPPAPVLPPTPTPFGAPVPADAPPAPAESELLQAAAKSRASSKGEVIAFIARFQHAIGIRSDESRA